MYQYQIIGVVIVMLCMLMLMIYYIIEVHDKKLITSLMQHIHAGNTTRISTKEFDLNTPNYDEMVSFTSLCDRVDNEMKDKQQTGLSADININYDISTNTLVMDTAALLNFLLSVVLLKVKTVQERHIAYSIVINLVHWLYTHIVRRR